jgi:membrane protease subunit HflK
MSQAPAPHVNPPGTDPAQQSLADALKVSFWVLRIVMIALVVFYLLSGFYRVAEQEAAVVTRFGSIVADDQGETTKDPGLYLGWPFPIDNVITVPTNDQTINLNRAFVYAGNADGEPQPGPLNPEADGSLVTGDANIVHARFGANYHVSDPEQFVTNFGDPDAVATLESRTGLAVAEALVRNMVEQGIVQTAASTTADEMIAGRFPSDRARNVAQRHLDELNVGITLTSLTIDNPEMPASVRDAYGLVSQAEAQRSTSINQAESERTQLLGEAGGKAALPVEGDDGPLVRLIKEYEIATTLDDADRLDAIDQQLSRALRDLTIQSDGETYDIGGETAGIINQALIEKSQISERIKTEAETVLELKAAYESDPELFKERRWQYVARQIFDDESGIELFYAPSGQRLLIEMNRDPDIVRTKERARLEAQMEENAEQ